MPKGFFNIGGLTFSTKKAAQDYTRQTITELGCCIIHKYHDKFNFFVNLLNNHPNRDEKVGCGIEYFYIEKNKIKFNAYQTMIRRSDNSIIDFSWRSCCEFKERSDDRNLSNAMRQAIYDDIREFKDASDLICNQCKTDKCDAWDFHVDHDEPPFRKLKEDFLQLNQLNVPTIFTSNSYLCMTTFCEEDSMFSNAWVQYHRANCKLQILCKTCNLRKR